MAGDKAGQIRLTTRRLVGLLGGPKVCGTIMISTSMMPDYPPVVECQKQMPEAKPAPPPPKLTIASFTDRELTRELVRRVMKDTNSDIQEIRIMMSPIDDKYSIDYTVEQHYDNV
jgi:hypothetical protein